MGGRTPKELSKIEGKESGDDYVDFLVMPNDGVPPRVLVAYDEISKAKHPTAIAKHPTLGYAVIQMGTNGSFIAWKDEIRDHVAPQPPPKNDPKAKPLWPMIIAEYEELASTHLQVGTQGEELKANIIRAMVADMRSRHEFGIAKYGAPLVAKNDRDHLSDAYQELLDAVVYLRAQIETMGGLPNGPREFYVKDLQYRTLVRIYAQTIENVIELRTILAERDGR